MDAELVGRGARGARRRLRARRMQSIVVVRPGNTGSGFRPWISPQGQDCEPLRAPRPQYGTKQRSRDVVAGTTPLRHDHVHHADPGLVAVDNRQRRGRLRSHGMDAL